MKGPWWTEVATVWAYSDTPQPCFPPLNMGWTRYLDTIAGSKEVVEEKGVTVDRQQCQQPGGTQQQEDSKGRLQARAEEQGSV